MQAELKWLKFTARVLAVNDPFIF